METEAKTNTILEQLNQSLGETLSFLKQSGGTAIDFAKEQTPLYVQEMLSYNFTISLIYFLIGAVCLSFSFYCIYRIFKFMLSDGLVPHKLRDKYSAYPQIIPNPSKEDFDKCKSDENELYVLRIPEGRMTMLIIGFIIFSLVGHVMFWNNTEWIKIKLAPRVYLVEQIKILTK